MRGPSACRAKHASKNRLRFVLLPTLLAVASCAVGQEFYEVQLRAGEAALSAGRTAEAVDDLRIAAFGFLDRPALLCEALATLALAQHAARHAGSEATLTRYVEVERGFPACREARLDGGRKAEFEALVRSKLPAAVAEEVLAPPARPSAPATSGPVASSGPIAVPRATATPPALVITPVPPEPAPMAIPPATPPPAPTISPATVSAPSDDLDRQPQLKTTTRPTYPASAQASGVGGIVLLRVLVSEKGEPQRVEVARGVRSDLDQSAVAAVSQWLFEPGRKGGVAVAAWMTVAVPFESPRR